MVEIKFEPLSSAVDVGFWTDLGDLKLNTLRLSEDPIDFYPQLRVSQNSGIPGAVECETRSLGRARGEREGGGDGLGEEADGEGLGSGRDTLGTGGPSPQTPPASLGAFLMRGRIWVLNTTNRLTEFDRGAVVEEARRELWSAISTGEAERDPSLLLPVLALTVCDLKKVCYYYWFGFPSLRVDAFVLDGVSELVGGLGEAAARGALDAVAARPPGAPFAFFLAIGQGSEGGRELGGVARGGGSVEDRVAGEAASADPRGPPVDVRVFPLHERELAMAHAGSPSNLLLAYADPGSLEHVPGWPLRALLGLAAARWAPSRLRVLAVRWRRGAPDLATSFLLDLSAREGDGAGVAEAVAIEGAGVGVAGAEVGKSEGLGTGLAACPWRAASGWEPNVRGRTGPRAADLGASADPARLAASAVRLNLSLMRWRAAPELDLRAVSSLRCLLLGAGTLGCATARTLQAWGVDDITLVDSGRVSYSNPVRQSLYLFEDCLGGGRHKAEAAAEALRRINPRTRSRGVSLAVPMPGHPPAGEKEAVASAAAAREIHELIRDHDVVFLLTDTRESRWLPTLIAASLGRLVINAALGFDGYLVMRHGRPVADDRGPEGGNEGDARGDVEGGSATAARVDLEGGDGGAARGGSSSGTEGPLKARGRPVPEPNPAPSPRLGCYFCNDVVAPQNSLEDRSLDQQCTVARPGLAAIAGSLGVELLAASCQRNGSLGDSPHMIRGALTGFSQQHMTGHAYRQCTACSETVVRAYRHDPAGLVRATLASPSYLEDLTGLTELHKESEALGDADWAVSDDESEGGDF